MPHDQDHNSVVADLIVRAQTLRDEFAECLRKLSSECAASRSNEPPVITRRMSEESRHRALSDYWHAVQESATRTSRIESGLSGVSRRLLKLIPQIKRGLVLCVARFPGMASALAGFNQLSLAVAPGNTIESRDSVIPDLDTMVGLLQIYYRNAGVEQSPSSISIKPSHTVSASDNLVRERRHGPRPDLEHHRRVAEVINTYGDSWRDHLDEICTEVDKRRVPLPKDWKKWGARLGQTVGDRQRQSAGPQSWHRALKLRRGLVIKALEYRLKAAPAYP